MKYIYVDIPEYDRGTLSKRLQGQIGEVYFYLDIDDVGPEDVELVLDFLRERLLK